MSYLSLKTYSFDGTNCLVTYEEGPTDIVTDPHEQKAMVARSRTKAVGAQVGLRGVIDTSFDLGTSLDFGQTRDEHSAQFTRPEQTVWGYFNRLMVEMGLQPTLQP